MIPDSWQSATDPLELLTRLTGRIDRRKALALRSALQISDSYLREWANVDEDSDFSALFRQVLEAHNENEFQDDAYTWVNSAEERATLIASRLRWQANIIREVITPPHVPPHFSAEWRSPAVKKLAQSMYAFSPQTGEEYERWFSAMPALGDALEAAACATAEVLHHCRCGAEHQPECWVLDLILEPSYVLRVMKR